MHLQIKMTLIEKSDDEDSEVGVTKELSFSTVEKESDVNVTLYDEDTSEMLEITVSRHELMKVLSVLQSISSDENECCNTCLKECDDDEDEDEDCTQDSDE